jgi:hypothetical protein
MNSPSAAKAAKAALVSVCQTLWPDPALVTYGPVGAFEPDEYAEILDVSFEEGAPRMGSARRRWHSFTITGRLTVYRGGDESVQQECTETALDMLGELADYLQDPGTVPSTHTSLSAAVQWARLSSFDLAEEDEDIEDGRKTYVDFEVTGEVVA